MRIATTLDAGKKFCRNNLFRVSQVLVDRGGRQYNQFLAERSKDRRLDGEGTSSGVVTSGMPMEVVREVREDPPEELEESNWPAKGGYGWVAADVRD